jgi:hypothetical protein
MLQVTHQLIHQEHHPQLAGKQQSQNDQLYTPKHQPFSCSKTTDNNINNIDSKSSTINNHVILPATSPQSSPSKTIPKENNLILISIRKFPLHGNNHNNNSNSTVPTLSPTLKHPITNFIDQ